MTARLSTRSWPSRGRRSASLLFALVCACKSDKTDTYVQFNEHGDSVTVSVGAADLLPSVGTELKSSTGAVIVGEASVDPGGGPIGTEHVATVEV